ncbi:MAG: hypothetical protein C0502_10100 [Opitutus sp.]|nr:hypothetical protein [Opitutus sp.]
MRVLSFQRTFVIAALLVGGWAASPAAAAPKEIFAGADDKWRRYESPHFELFSHVDDADSRAVLHQLELLRSFFLDSNRLSERQPVPVSVYAFATQKEFDAYKPANFGNAAGLYLSRPDRAVILLAPSRQDEAARRIVFHEYIHHLVRVSGMTPPTWLNEGLAELFSTIELRGDKMVFGAPVPYHVYRLQNSEFIPLASLFSAAPAEVHTGSDSHSGRFYAQAWAVLHYWYFGATRTPREKIHPLLSRLLSARTPPTHDQMARWLLEATGETYTQLQQQLVDYVRHGKYGTRALPLPKIAGKETYQARPMARAEARERLAELAFRMRRDPHGHLAMLEAAKTGDTIRALETLGTDALLDSNDHLAQERWEAATAAGSKNPAIYHELGVQESRRWFAQFDLYFRLPEERAKKLRGLLQRSIAYAPDQAEAYEMLAWVEATAPQPDIANVNLVQSRFDTLNQKVRTIVALAFVRVRTADYAGATKLLDAIDQTEAELAACEAVKAMRRFIEAKTAAGN